MELRKIKVSSVICPDRFYRIMYVDENMNLEDLGHKILTALRAEFEHMFYFQGKNCAYIHERWLMEFGRICDRDYAECKLSEVKLKSDKTFRLIYDSGENWEFIIKVYAAKKEFPDGIDAVVTEAKGDRIWEDSRFAFESYIFGWDYDWKNEELIPWNIPDGKVKSFDKKIDLEELNEEVKNA